MDIWEAVEILNESYQSDGRDLLDDCRKIKDEISEEIVGLSYDELMRYCDNCDFDDSEIKLDGLNRESLLEIIEGDFERGCGNLKREVICV